jgi:hypothetical protein
MTKNVSYTCDKCKQYIITRPHEFHVIHHYNDIPDNRWYLCSICYKKWYYFLANQDYKEQ